MSKLRVHELAKELGKQNKEVMNYLTEKGITVKSHMSTIEEGMVDDIRKNIGKGTAKPATGAGEVKAQEEKKYITGIPSAEQPYRNAAAPGSAAFTGTGKKTSGKYRCSTASTEPADSEATGKPGS